MQVSEAFDLNANHNILMIFDCPTSGDSQTYSTISESIIEASTNIAMIFLDTEVPSQFQKAVNTQHKAKLSASLGVSGASNLLIDHKSSQNTTSTTLNLVSTYDIQYVWLLIGIFSA